MKDGHWQEALPTYDSLGCCASSSDKDVAIECSIMQGIREDHVRDMDIANSFSCCSSLLFSSPGDGRLLAWDMNQDDHGSHRL